MFEYGVELVDCLFELIVLYDVLNIVVVIVELFFGLVGVVVLLKGYLKCLCDICIVYDILLIFDEVIMGFGCVGVMMGVDVFGVVLDIMNFVKQVMNGVQLFGGVIVMKEIYDMFMVVGGFEYMFEFLYGYMYLVYLVVCVVGVVVFDLLVKEDVVVCVCDFVLYFEVVVYGLKGQCYIVDICNYGLVVGLMIVVLLGELVWCLYEIVMCCWVKGFYVCYGGDMIQFVLLFIVEKCEIDNLVNVLFDVLNEVD